MTDLEVEPQRDLIVDTIASELRLAPLHAHMIGGAS